MGTDQFLMLKGDLADMLPSDDSAELPSDEVWRLFRSIDYENSTCARVFVLLGHCLELGIEGVGRFADPLSCYDHALSIDGTCAEALRAKGHHFALTGDYTASFESFRLAHALEGTVESSVGLAVASRHLGYRSDFEAEAADRLSDLGLELGEE